LCIFNKDFNTDFKIPQSDTCDEFCTKIEGADESSLLKLTKELENSYYLHYREVQWKKCHLTTLHTSIRETF
jgi:hypothetical protein